MLKQEAELTHLIIDTNSAPFLSNLEHVPPPPFEVFIHQHPTNLDPPQSALSEK